MVGQSRVEEGILILIQIELSSRVRSNKDKCVYAVNVTVRSATYITNTLVRKLVSEKNVFIRTLALSTSSAWLSKLADLDV